MQIIGDTILKSEGIRVVLAWSAPYSVTALVDLEQRGRIDYRRRPSFAETHDTPEHAEEMWSGLEKLICQHIGIRES